MCIDFPGRVVERIDDAAIVECAGRRRRASTLLWPNVAIGDWVFIAFGTVIERLDEETARQINHELAIAEGVAR
jgi:hydrogenase assembly chaperone HypC/HupF